MNNILDDYEFISSEDLEEYDSECILYSHKKTGCQICHIKNEDRDNLFAFIFMTPPENSRGVAHIIEHSVLSGSERFPVKDPFIQLLKTSVNTYLNAATYPDRTVYPGSSTVPKDYFNLMEVYGDAVFFPLLRKETFMQESSIVFNEMKGAYSDQASVLDEYSYRILFPDTAFKYDSGGVPDDIHELSYDEFAAFHKKYYHPSNCRIFLYGNIDTEKQLEFLDTHFLSRFDKGRRMSPVPVQKKYRQLFTADAVYPAQNDEKLGSISLNWLGGESADISYVMKSQILSKLVLSMPSSLLYRRLVESGIAEDISSVTGASVSIRQVVFSVGVRGISRDKAGEFRKLVLSELEDIASKPIDEDLVRGIFHRMEFSDQEIRTGNGRLLMNRIMPGWLYADSFSAILHRRKALRKIMDEYEQDRYLFNRMIRSEFLDNGHSSLVTVSPGNVPEPAEPEKDDAAFEKYKNSQDSPEDIKKIPVLCRQDIPLEVEKPGFSRKVCGGNIWYTNRIFTGGIVYADIFFELSGLDERSLLYMPLLCNLLKETGVGDIPFYKVSAGLDMLVGGWSLDPYCITAGDMSCPNILLRFAALDKDADTGFSAVMDVLQNGNLDDRERIKAVATNMKNTFREMLLDCGNSVAMAEAGGMLRKQFWVECHWQGIAQLEFLEKLDCQNEDMLNDLIQHLESLRTSLLHGRKTVTVSCGESFDADTLGKYIGEYSGPETAEQNIEFEAETGARCFVTGSMVNFDAMCIDFPGYGQMDYVPEGVLAHILSTGYLWEKIRMEAGAYGASAMADGVAHLFSFSSYRDPEIESTYKIFRRSLEFIADGNLDDDTLEQAVITLAGQELYPVAPGRKGFRFVLMELDGRSYEVRKKRLEILLKLSVNDIINTARELLSYLDKSALAVVAGRSSAEKEKIFLQQHNYIYTYLSI